MNFYHFQKALPVWQTGMECTKNHHLAFLSKITGNQDTRLSLSASTVYQAFVNGQLVGEGPARAGHGHHRVDELDLTPYLGAGENMLVIYVAGYYIECLCYTREPSFFCAEILRDGEIVAATGHFGFTAREVTERPQKVERFSYQRTYCEYYRLTPETRAYETDSRAPFEAVELSVQSDKKFLTRGVPYPAYETIYPREIVTRGTAQFADEPHDPNRTRFVDLVPDCDGFPLSELVLVNSDEAEKGRYTITSRTCEPYAPTVIAPNGFAVFRFAGNRTGFIRLNLEAEGDTRLILVYDELDVDGDVTTYRTRELASTMVYDLEKGAYSLTSHEPYGFQYIKVINRSDSPVTLRDLYLTSFVFDVDVAPLDSGDDTLDEIFDAAVQTFRQNTLDVFMDCVTRERAGWLCDSFFTARVERALTGKSLVERNHLENFLATETFPYHPDGMIPMCYPSDIRSGMFIPNWAMFYILELEEYYLRTGDADLVASSRERVLGILRYFEKFRNSDGLLEDLESWVFVEWSCANTFTDGVNYPSNMMYAKSLAAAARLYGMPELATRSAQVLSTVRAQSYFDGFFHDHALRDADGVLRVVSEDISETCQYYAFFTGAADLVRDRDFFDLLCRDFGFKRAETGLYPEVGASNAFIGNYLRIELMMQAGLEEQALSEIRGFFTHMARLTGTLWEHQSSTNSCNHGFASHVIVWLYKIFKKHYNVKNT